ncbi:MAG: isochorismate-pyruvate lyase [Chitinivibrionales bacterium]|nr:isochorismate-pyruvate lyase [Chitinivibrionales bacterium]
MVYRKGGVVIRSPYECSCLEQVRREIDRIDREIVYSLRLRAEYVEAAAKYKRTDDDVRADGRVTAMLAERREWAECDGVSADLVERLYRLIVAHGIAHEQGLVQARREEDNEAESEPAFVNRRETAEART